MRVETRRDDNGRLLNLTIYKGTAKKVRLQFDFAQDEFIDTIEFTGRKEDMPTASEIVALINTKFMERVQTLGNIEAALPTGTNSIGQVTANAGTNLNTSLLALEAGGNLAALVAKDFATQTTLALLKARADLLATEATLATIHGHIDAIETDLALVHAHIGSIDAKITACNTGAVAQDTRTNLLNKPEREDLLLKDVDFAANVALQSYLAAVAGQKHKVYAYGYESDADGIYYLSATVNAAAFKFGRRITKGVMVQTLVHPITCDVNTALNFMSTTGNSKAWIQYKTEA